MSKCATSKEEVLMLKVVGKDQKSGDFKFFRRAELIQWPAAEKPQMELKDDEVSLVLIREGKPDEPIEFYFMLQCKQCDFANTVGEVLQTEYQVLSFGYPIEVQGAKRVVYLSVAQQGLSHPIGADNQVIMPK